ncbi:hypothetical protein ONR75_19000 [Rhodopseudomonas sp. P2A-2r]|uniref:hypothetical protein n=1 Tax=Rhodopseudomonas sp. P2A-2r TaxID=2991972 RepID=UPI002234992C|nr:hypothetical protein [Rhodopseudomonas sp. P2A-2r]UZE47078.1 hypothetical protein ONR75_19000 [Rhodopseudomonas sp. P2A-2r]
MITTVLETESPDNQFELPAMSVEEARRVIKRYDEIVAVRIFNPDGWRDWYLEFSTGQFDSCTFDVDAVYESETGKRQSINIIHRSSPCDLREELRQVQLEADSDNPHLCHPLFGARNRGGRYTY